MRRSVTGLINNETSRPDPVGLKRILNVCLETGLDNLNLKFDDFT